MYPQCFATILAKVVLPQPGGPDNKISLCSSNYSLPFEFYYFSLWYCCPLLGCPNLNLEEFIRAWDD